MNDRTVVGVGAGVGAGVGVGVGAGVGVGEGEGEGAGVVVGAVVATGAVVAVGAVGDGALLQEIASAAMNVGTSRFMILSTFLRRVNSEYRTRTRQAFGRA